MGEQCLMLTNGAGGTKEEGAFMVNSRNAPSEIIDVLLYKISFFISDASEVAPGALVIVALPV